jgi:hypothetical protein
MLHALARMLMTLAALGTFGGGGTAAARTGDWPTYHGDNARTGVASSPKLGQLTRAWSATLDGQVYASPLISGGRVIVATENNSVYAFDGSGRQVWRRHVGTPVSGGSLPCGNIDTSGITGTPAVDTGGGTVYAVAFLSGFRHQLVAIDIGSGKVRWRRPIDGKGSDGRVEQQRGALVVSHGRVYVPYGGLYGDCGNYHGLVVSRTLSGSSVRTYTNPAREAGIWAPGGLAADARGNIFGATGNGAGPGFGYSNAVIRLTATLRRTAYWAPHNWSSLSGSDTDVGSIQPALLAGGSVFQSGKNGVGYLLGPKLGGIGGEMFSAQVCSGAYGGTAYQAPLLYVPCTDGLYALRVTGGSFTAAWRSGGFSAGPPIVAGGAVWSINRSSGTLHGYDATSGREVARTDLGGAVSFPTPAAAGTLLVAPANDSIVAFRGV